MEKQKTKKEKKKEKQIGDGGPAAQLEKSLDGAKAFLEEGVRFSHTIFSKNHYLRKMQGNAACPVTYSREVSAPFSIVVVSCYPFRIAGFPGPLKRLGIPLDQNEWVSARCAKFSPKSSRNVHGKGYDLYRRE